MEGFEMPPPSQDVLNREEAAAVARVTPGKIDQWVSIGLKHMRTGSDPGRPGPANVIILRKHLMAWIESHVDSVAELATGKSKRGRRPKQASSSPGGGPWVS